MDLASRSAMWGIIRSAVLLAGLVWHALGWSVSNDAPPRTVNDVFVLLKQVQRDPIYIEEGLRRVKAPPPDGMNDGQMVRFLLERGRLAMELGYVGQAQNDLRMALDKAGSEGFDALDAVTELQRVERLAGNYEAALSLFAVRRSIAARQKRPPQLVGALSAEAREYASLGLLDEARRSMREASAIRERVSARMKERVPDAIWSWTLDRGWAAVYKAEGKLEEEEKALAKVRAVADTVVDHSAQNRRMRGAASVESRLTSATEEVELDIAENMLRQGRAAVAEVATRKVLVDRFKRTGELSLATAKTVSLLGTILMEQGRYDEALSLLGAALQVYRDIGVIDQALPVLRTRARIGSIHVLRQDWKRALEVFDGLRESTGGYPRLQEVMIRRNVDWSLAMVAVGRGSEALPVLEEMIRISRRDLGDGAVDTAEWRGVLALALVGTGNRRMALEHFSESVKVLIGGRLFSSDESVELSTRAARRRLILEGYLALLGELVESESPGSQRARWVEEAFRVADAARGGAVRRALSASAARTVVDDPALGELIRQSQDGRRQIDMLYALLVRLSAAAPDQQVPKVMSDIRDRIQQLEVDVSRMGQEIAKRFPRYAEVADPKPPTVPEVRRHLLAGEVLLSIYVGSDRTYVWSIAPQGEISFAVTKVSAAEVGRLVDSTRRALDSGADSLTALPRFDVVSSHRLFELLLQPVSSVWKPAQHVIVVAHGSTAMLPFSVLLTEPAKLVASGVRFEEYRNLPWLINKVALSQLPSADALVSLRQERRQRLSHPRFAGFGDPLFSVQQAAMAEPKIQVAALDTGLLLRRSTPRLVEGDGSKTHSVALGSLPRLPDTADEIRSIAASLGADAGKDVYLGRAANERNVDSNTLGDRTVIAFATHGLVPGDLNGLEQPALALSAPEVAGVEGDGLLTLEEIMRLKLNADWVVLSACNTGAADGRGAEAVSGLGRAFFYAGARALLVSNWPVETSSARRLTTEMFRLQSVDAALPRAQALRRSMMSLLSGPGYQDGAGKTVFSYAHPMFWAPFSLIGEGANR